MKYTNAQMDRAEGVLLGTAAGDALGAPYEFGLARGPEQEVAMVGGGAFGWEPGEWTDDTSMAVAIAEVAAEYGDLRDEENLYYVLRRWQEWLTDAKDVGVQTSTILRKGGARVLAVRAEAKRLYEQDGSAGNGSLMRTAPVALAYLDDEQGLVQAARAISELTHFSPDAVDACVLWSCAIRHAVLTGELDVRIGLNNIDVDRRQLWIDRLEVSENSSPADFTNNGWVVAAFQAAWSAVVNTPVPVEDPAAGVFRADHLRFALEAAVRGGHDTDTVAAIAGGLLGAAYGASAIPVEWSRVLRGWPGISSHDLVTLARKVVLQGDSDDFDPDYKGHCVDTLARHPDDDGVLLGGIGALWPLPKDVDAIVSLCRVGDDDVRDDIPHIEIRLIDSDDPNDNPNLDFVLSQAANTVAQLRQERRVVLLHCVAAFSRTPTVAALYGGRLRRVDADVARADIGVVLPGSYPNIGFRRALRRLLA